MSYQRAEDVLPVELVEVLQNYIDGEYIYIPRKEVNKKKWGSNTKIKEELMIRNAIILDKYKSGISILELSEEYFLSIKSIQRILLEEKKRIINT